jgi:hypothetical protein
MVGRVTSLASLTSQTEGNPRENSALFPGMITVASRYLGAHPDISPYARELLGKVNQQVVLEIIVLVPELLVLHLQFPIGLNRV